MRKIDSICRAALTASIGLALALSCAPWGRAASHSKHPPAAKSGQDATQDVAQKSPGTGNVPPDDCSWEYTGVSREAVKLRSPDDGNGYQAANGGKPMTLDQWFTFTCALDPKVPEKIPETVMAGIETIKVSLKAFLLAARFERAGDHDIHFELGGVPSWDCEHVIVELPPAPEYCTARKTLWSLVKNDMELSKGATNGSVWILHTPVPVLVTGFVFLDGHHAAKGSRDYCHDNGGRGIEESEVQGKTKSANKRPPSGESGVDPSFSELQTSQQSEHSPAQTAPAKAGAGSKVRGLWELHPVIDVQSAISMGQQDQRQQSPPAKTRRRRGSGGQ